MNWQTKKKAEEIKELLTQGYNQKYILEKKFNRSKANLKKHIEKADEIYTSDELEILKGTMEQPITNETAIQPVKELPQALKLLSNKDSVNRLEQLLTNSDEILALLKTNNKVDHTVYAETILDIPKEYLKFDDIKLKSVRLSEDISKKFDLFCKKQKENYSKTTLLNYALVEFMEKYLDN